MADIATLKKRRAYIKGSMTKLLNFIKAISQTTNTEEIKVRLTNVERYRNEFIELENSIISLDKEEELDVDFEENYYNVVAGLNLALRKKIEPSMSLNDTFIDTSTVGNHIEVKLPKISIPVFSGDYTEWQSFHDLYCSTIHDNNKLTPSQKLQYLKGSLKGEAAGLLKHFSVTDANYIEALGKLRERYDRRKHTIYAFIKSFMSQSVVATPNSTNVRTLLDTSDEIIRGLKALGEAAETRDHWLIHILVNKLDYETNSLWAQTSAEYDLPTLKQFFDFLAKRVDALESLRSQNKRPQLPPIQSKQNVRSHVVTGETNKTQTCSVCTENHRLFECSNFKDMALAERKSFLIRENRCFNCLNNNHSVYNCKSKFRCKLCNRKHHSLLHENQPITMQANAAQNEVQPSEPETSSHTTNTNIGSSILPTALIRIADAHNQTHLYRALLDSGSQVSFISENCAQQLKLPRNNARIAITGIGATESGHTKGSVSLSITPWNKLEPNIQIKAFVFPKLTAKTTTGISLNECLAVGPTVQPTLYEILCRFRMFKIVFTADVEKMFRQVLVAEEDTKFQRILWRDSPDKAFSTYELQTVTYGTASATYLATRALNEAAAKSQEEFPEAADHIRNHFYVDDLMTGADSLQEAITLKSNINDILTRSGFHLRKWLANDETLVRNTCETTAVINNLEIEKSTSVKVLGLHWNPTTDCFQFKVNLNKHAIMTKRGILSESSRLFDPLGWLAPITVSIKIFFQTLWAKNLKWDEKLPLDIENEWRNLRDNLPKIEEIVIERYIHTNSNSKISLHGFSDASRYAYSAVVYAHIIKPNGDSIVKLLSAKTKVAPVKQISIPRLELCGALLLSKLLLSLKQTLKTEITDITAWTDSTVVLDWLSAPPAKWNTFVGNRTGEILTSMSRSQWRHVNSKDNPADCASRGISPGSLPNFSLWWNGPKWIANCAAWPKSPKVHINTTEELRIHSLQTQLYQINIIDDLVKRISSYEKITRILAYVLRFIDIKLRRTSNNFSLPYLHSQELRKPQQLLLKHIQLKHFALEHSLLTINKELPSSSKLKYLNPFLDESGLLRVGGRLSNASITYTIKHPVILPARDEITESIVTEHHLRYLHAGQSLMIATLRQKYWVLGCRQLVRKVVHKCLKCLRYKGETIKQIMGNLPNPRVELVRPFYKVGVDYAGPFQTRLVRGRGNKTTYKSYICIFVCLATKALHIELVSELTTESYIAALRRFIARRGICKENHSDNGTNFIGDEISFKFIPPSAPHFGGLWEAAVKQVKYHLRRVTDGHTLTTEEMTTLLAEIEAILNSRPICVLSSEDLEYLTPAHFLIGRPTTQLPNADLQDVKLSRLSRWQLVQKMNQDIWKRWHLEYLTNMQHRSKWNKKENNVKIGDVVIIKENNLPPSKWLMGKIIEVHPGADKAIRVVTLKTTNGVIKRPIHKLCLLPIM